MKIINGKIYRNGLSTNDRYKNSVSKRLFKKVFCKLSTVEKSAVEEEIEVRKEYIRNLTPILIDGKLSFINK